MVQFKSNWLINTKCMISGYGRKYYILLFRYIIAYSRRIVGYIYLLRNQITIDTWLLPTCLSCLFVFVDSKYILLVYWNYWLDSSKSLLSTDTVAKAFLLLFFVIQTKTHGIDIFQLFIFRSNSQCEFKLRFCWWIIC